MSHDSHSENDKQSEINKSKTSLGSSFWLVVILVILFISALNFVNVMSKETGEKKEPQKTEAPAAAGKDEKSTPSANQIPNIDSGGHKMSGDTSAGR